MVMICSGPSRRDDPPSTSIHRRRSSRGRRCVQKSTARRLQSRVRLGVVHDWRRRWYALLIGSIHEFQRLASRAASCVGSLARDRLRPALTVMVVMALMAGTTDATTGEVRLLAVLARLQIKLGQVAALGTLYDRCGG